MEQQDALGESQRFGKYLRKIREERKLSLDAVEEMSLGFRERVTKSHLSRIENGQAVPTFPRIFTLSQIYGVPVTSIAERFELDLMREVSRVDLQDKPVEELLDEAKKMRLAGRHTEALVLYDALQEHAVLPEGVQRADLRLARIVCLMKLARFRSAKEECEDLLGIAELSQKQRVFGLQFLADCCYRLGKMTMSMMAIESAKRGVESIADRHELRVLSAQLTALEGSLLSITGCYADGARAFETAVALFGQVPDPFEGCRCRVNLGAALLEAGDIEQARTQLKQALEEAETQGFDRHAALALSNLALLAYRENDQLGCEAYCLRSNSMARPQEYRVVVFRNCYYLWLIARARDDEAGARVNERSLRTLLSRIEEHLPEADAFRAHLTGSA